MIKTKKLFIIILLLIAIALGLYVFWHYGGFQQKGVVKYQGREYYIGTNASLSEQEAQNKWGKLVKQTDIIGIGELWTGESECTTSPCPTHTVILIKQKDGRFQEYALSGGP